jgi:hypothetical protein
VHHYIQQEHASAFYYATHKAKGNMEYSILASPNLNPGRSLGSEIAYIVLKSGSNNILAAMPGGKDHMATKINQFDKVLKQLYK